MDKTTLRNGEEKEAEEVTRGGKVEGKAEEDEVANRRKEGSKQRQRNDCEETIIK